MKAGRRMSTREGVLSTIALLIKTQRAMIAAEMKKNSTTADTSHPEKILQPCMQDKTLQHNLGPIKYDEPLSLNHRYSWL
ncbi:hypothetical protein E2542_SST07084 [Spatholobus suberectus]|nr:hypothetical protein E2542_SST07084 [Spatholobus suberectus]